MTGAKVATALTVVLKTRGKPEAITVDNGTEFVSRAMDVWAYLRTAKDERDLLRVRS